MRLIIQGLLCEEYPRAIQGAVNNSGFSAMDLACFDEFRDVEGVLIDTIQGTIGGAHSFSLHRRARCVKRKPGHQARWYPPHMWLVAIFALRSGRAP